MKTLIINLFGSYVPQSYQSVIVLSDGTTQSVDIIPSGWAGVDFEWFAGVLLFGITLYCVLRIVGGLLKDV